MDIIDSFSLHQPYWQLETGIYSPKQLYKESADPILDFVNRNRRGNKEYSILREFELMNGSMHTGLGNLYEHEFVSGGLN